MSDIPASLIDTTNSFESIFAVQLDTKQRFENMLNGMQEPKAFPLPDIDKIRQTEVLSSENNKGSVIDALFSEDRKVADFASDTLEQQQSKLASVQGVGVHDKFSYDKSMDKFLKGDYGYNPYMSIEDNEDFNYRYDYLGSNVFTRILKNVGTGLGRFGGSLVMKLGQTVGHVGAMIYGGLLEGVEAVGGPEHNFMTSVADNSFSRWFEHQEEDLKSSNLLSVFKPRGWEDKGFFAKATHGAFWTDEFADGAAFMGEMVASMYLLGGLGKIGALGRFGATPINFVSKMGRSGKFLDMAAKFATGADDIAGVGRWAFSVASEAAFEASGAFTTRKEELLRKRENGENNLSDDAINKEAGDVASALFKANILILSASNAFENRLIFGPLFKKGGIAEATAGQRGGSKFSKLIGISDSTKNLDEVAKASRKSYDYKNWVGKKLNWKDPNSRLNFYGGRALSATGMEGLWEENAQLAAERLASVDTLSRGSFLDKTGAFAKQIGHQTIDAITGDDPEASTSIGLGALIGIGGTGVVAKVKGGSNLFKGERKQLEEDVQNRVAIYEETRRKFLNFQDIYLTEDITEPVLDKEGKPVLDADGQPKTLTISKPKLDADGNLQFDDTKLEGLLDGTNRFASKLAAADKIVDPIFRKVLQDEALTDFVMASKAVGVFDKASEKFQNLDKLDENSLRNLGFDPTTVTDSVALNKSLKEMGKVYDDVYEGKTPSLGKNFTEADENNRKYRAFKAGTRVTTMQAALEKYRQSLDEGMQLSLFDDETEDEDSIVQEFNILNLQMQGHETAMQILGGENSPYSEFSQQHTEKQAKKYMDGFQNLMSKLDDGTLVVDPFSKIIMSPARYKRLFRLFAEEDIRDNRDPWEEEINQAFLNRYSKGVVEVLEAHKNSSPSKLFEALQVYLSSTPNASNTPTSQQNETKSNYIAPPSKGILGMDPQYEGLGKTPEEPINRPTLRNSDTVALPSIKTLEKENERNSTSRKVMPIQLKELELYYKIGELTNTLAQNKYSYDKLQNSNTGLDFNSEIDKFYESIQEKDGEADGKKKEENVEVPERETLTSEELQEVKDILPEIQALINDIFSQHRLAEKDDNILVPYSELVEKLNEHVKEHARAIRVILDRELLTNNVSTLIKKLQAKTLTESYEDELEIENFEAVSQFIFTLEQEGLDEELVKFLKAYTDPTTVMLESYEFPEKEPDSKIIDESVIDDTFLKPLVEMARAASLEKRADALPFEEERFDNKVKSLKENIKNKEWQKVNRELMELFAIVNTSIGNKNTEDSIEAEESIILLGKYIFKRVSNAEIAQAIIEYKNINIARGDTSIGFPQMDFKSLGMKMTGNTSGTADFILSEGRERGILTEDYYKNELELKQLEGIDLTLTDDQYVEKHKPGFKEEDITSFKGMTPEKLLERAKSERQSLEKNNPTVAKEVLDDTVYNRPVIAALGGAGAGMIATARLEKIWLDSTGETKDLVKERITTKEFADKTGYDFVQGTIHGVKPEAVESVESTDKALEALENTPPESSSDTNQALETVAKQGDRFISDTGETYVIRGTNKKGGIQYIADKDGTKGTWAKAKFAELTRDGRLKPYTKEEEETPQEKIERIVEGLALSATGPFTLYPQGEDLKFYTDNKAEIDKLVKTRIAEIKKEIEGDPLPAENSSESHLKSENKVDDIIDESRTTPGGKITLSQFNPEEIATDKRGLPIVKEGVLQLKTTIGTQQEQLQRQHNVLKVMGSPISPVNFFSKDDKGNNLFKMTILRGNEALHKDWVYQTEKAEKEPLGKPYQFPYAIAVITDQNGDPVYFNLQGAITDKANGQPVAINYTIREYESKNLNTSRKGIILESREPLAAPHGFVNNDPLADLRKLINAGVPVFATIDMVTAGRLSTSNVDNRMNNYQQEKYTTRTVKEMMEAGDIERDSIMIMREGQYFEDIVDFRGKQSQRIKIGQPYIIDSASGFNIPLNSKALGKVTVNGELLIQGETKEAIVGLQKDGELTIDANSSTEQYEKLENIFTFLRTLFYSQDVSFSMSADKTTIIMEDRRPTHISLLETDINYTIGIDTLVNPFTGQEFSYPDLIKENFTSGAIPVQLDENKKGFAKLNQRIIFTIDKTHQELIDAGAAAEPMRKPTRVTPSNMGAFVGKVYRKKGETKTIEITGYKNGVFTIKGEGGEITKKQADFMKDLKKLEEVILPPASEETHKAMGEKIQLSQEEIDAHIEKSKNSTSSDLKKNTDLGC